MNSSELDRLVRALRNAQELLKGSPEVAEALTPALNVSFFLLNGHGPNFEDYLAAFRGTALPFLGAFSSREEFDAWLKAHFVPPPRGSVQVAGERYTLAYSRLRGEPLLLRLPSMEDLRRPRGAERQEWLWFALGTSPEDLEGLRTAVLGLHFVDEVGCAREFAHFLAHFDEHQPPLCSFATREEAEAWLKSHPGPPHGATVQVGQDELTVGYWPETDHRVLLRFPKDEELDEVEEEEDLAP